MMEKRHCGSLIVSVLTAALYLFMGWNPMSPEWLNIMLITCWIIIPGDIQLMGARLGIGLAITPRSGPVRISCPSRRIWLCLLQAAQALHFPLNDLYICGCMKTVVARVGGIAMQFCGIRIT